MAEVKDITMDQGTDFDPTFIIRNPDKSPFNLTGYDARMMVRETYDSAEPVLSLDITNGKLDFTSTPGRIKLDIRPADTTDIAFSGEAFNGVYDLEVVSPSGVVTRAAMGAFIINREVTRNV